MSATAAPGTTATVVARLEAVRSGGGGLVLLTGEAGIGKTFRARAWAEAAESAGFTTVWATAQPGAPAYWPWIQVLRAMSAAEILRDVDESLDLRARFELFEQVTVELAAAAAKTPLLIVLDDMHRADIASLRLLQYLAGSVRRLRILLVATLRPASEADGWAEVLAIAETLPVAPLPEAEVARMLAAATGETADPLAVQRILLRTGGNAFFVRELVGLVAHDPGALEQLPETVRAVVAARVADRSASCRRLLAVMAVLGTAAPLRRVVDAFAEPAPVVADLLDEAVAAGLLTLDDGVTVRFVHEIVRDAVYGNLPTAHRLYWHGVIADRMASEPDPEPAAIAEHWRLAGPEHAAESGRWWQRAGDERLSALAYEDAARCYERASESPGDTGIRQLRLGDACLATGDTARARAAYLDAVATGRRDQDPDLVAAGALGLGSGPAGFEVALHDREQVSALEDALTLLPAEPGATRATVLARLSVALTYPTDGSRRAELADSALRTASAAGDEAALAAALAARCDVRSGPEHVAERLADAERIIEIAQRRRDASLELVGRRMRIVARLELGDMAGFTEDARQFELLARALRQPLYLWYGPLWRAMTALAAGSFPQCAHALSEAARLGASAGSANAYVLTSTLRWCLAVDSGDRDDLEVVGRLLDEIDAVWVVFTKALVAVQLGHIDEARTLLDIAARERDALPRDGNWLATVAQVAEALGSVGPHPIAGWVYEQLLPFAGLFVVEGIGAVRRGDVERHLGLAATALGRNEIAAAHFERALRANRGLGAPLLVAKTIADARRAPATVPPVAADARFAREGELWQLAFGGHTATVRDCKGLHDIARLLARPGVPVPALDLVTAPGHSGANAENLHEPGDLGELIDDRARREYRRRLSELEQQADAADLAGDGDRSARIAAERAALLAQLSAAFGLGGRPRRTGSPVERARTTATARIRDAIRRVAAAHPELGRHLRLSIKTGTVCCYEPDGEVRWLTS
ncbi:AAA family ATPase [Nocardia seriolae]|uniref:ATP-binding protein n=1 Tax=Nocardia seriolae TaxID=37332 RepID=UPI0012BC201D|nr:AAA family ATPase [Nocardia seriolae]MTL13874.1 AAA family ATPase [Nocardia seriolae]